MKNIYKLIIVVAILLLLFLLKDWWKDRLIISLGGYTKKTEKITIDTTAIKRDTVYLDTSKRDIKPVIQKIDIDITEYKELLEKYKKELELVKGKESAKDSIYRYSTKVEDSLINGNITTLIHGRTASLIDQKFNYNPKFPKTITETITIRETKTETLSKERNKFGVGLEASNLETLGVKAIYLTKNDWVFEIGYNKAFNNELIFREKPVEGFITIGVSKTF